MLSFVIDENGAAVDPVIEDTSGERAFDKEALKIVRSWRYSPATVAGVPVPQRQTRLVLTYAMDYPRRGASLRFREGHARANEALAAGDYSAAEREWRSLAEFEGWNLYETARLWTLYAAIGEARGDSEVALEGLQRACRGGGAYLQQDLYLAALRKIFVLQLQSGNRSGALQTYAQLEVLPGALDAYPEIVAAAQSVRQRVAGPEVLAEEGQLEEVAGTAFWTRRLLRREVGLTDTVGKLERIEFRCDWGRITDRPEEGTRWQLPADYGDCDVYLFGREGARFTLLEFPESGE